MPSEAHDPAPPVKDNGDDIDACVLRQVFCLMMLPVYLSEAGKAMSLVGSDGLLRGAYVGRGSAAHLDGYKRLVDNANNIEFPGAIADILRQDMKTLGFNAAAGKALGMQPTPGAGGWA